MWTRSKHLSWRRGASSLDALVVGLLFLVAGALWFRAAGGCEGLADAWSYLGCRAHEVSRIAP